MTEKSFFKKEVSPFLQSSVIGALMLVFIGIGWIIDSVNGPEKDEMMPWVIVIAMLMFYTMINCVFSLSSQNQNKYWGRSLIGYLLILIIGAVVSWLISGINPLESRSLRWLFIVFTFVYFVLISILGFMRKIVSYAQKQDKRLRGED